MRPGSFLAALLAAVLSVGALASPASAAAQITLDPVSRAGHVTGTLSGVPAGTPYVRFRLDYSAVQSDNVPVVDGTASFDLPTWGYREPLVDVGSCTGPEAASCAGGTVLATSPTFLARDVVPTTTWSDRTLTGTQALTATVQDPDGGGDLRVLWRPDGGGADRSGILARSGTTTVPVGEGRGVLRVFRCASGDQHHCQQVGSDVPVERDGTVGAQAFVDPYAVRGDASSASLYLRLSDPGAWTVDWRVEDGSGATVSSGARAVTIGTSSNVAGVVLPLPEELSPGTARVVGTASRTSAAGDAFTAPFEAGFVVDATAPEVDLGTASPSTFFPAGDGYLDTTAVEVTTRDERGDFDTVELEVRDAAGTLQATRTGLVGSGPLTLRWDGSDRSGRLVPAGSYTLRARATDRQGNTSAWTDESAVTVDRRQLVPRQWTKVVSASGSLVSRASGRCSRVRVPSLRRWSGSVGLESGSRCRTTSVAANSAATVHQVTLPALGAAPNRRDALEVEVHGGAATAAPRSTALMGYRLTDGGYVATRRLASGVGTHHGPVVDPDRLLRGDGSVRWRLDVAGRSRYDVRSFRVTYTYSVLE